MLPLVQLVERIEQLVDTAGLHEAVGGKGGEQKGGEKFSKELRKMIGEFPKAKEEKGKSYLKRMIMFMEGNRGIKVELDYPPNLSHLITQEISLLHLKFVWALASAAAW